MIQVVIADYVTSLLNFDETKVLIGRDNANQEVFSENYIVVDVLNNNNISNGNDYDSDTELMKHNAVMSGTFTLEFYGSDGYTNVFKFINMLSSQLASDLQKESGITIYKPKSINDLKQIVGNKYFDRYEVEIVVQYNQSFEIDTLRIEEIPVIQITDLFTKEAYEDTNKYFNEFTWADKFQEVVEPGIFKDKFSLFLNMVTLKNIYSIKYSQT